MPIYEYEHTEKACNLGKIFEAEHSIKDPPLAECPECGGAVKRVISMTNVNTPKTDSELKSMGFTKLVRRDKGVYENVTATGNESKIWEADKPHTAPNIKKKIKD